MKDNKNRMWHKTLADVIEARDGNVMVKVNLRDLKICFVRAREREQWRDFSMTEKQELQPVLWHFGVDAHDL